ncbi:MAG: energy-coupling factor transporter transmembrane protein EcfT, partial [Oscillospiraceae bacterium]
MLKDITIGQYFPGKSFVHNMDSRMKIVLTFAYIIMLFMATNIPSLMIGVVVGILLYAISKIPFNMIIK